MHTTLISPQDLRSLLDAGTPLQVYDCSFDMADPSLGRAMYEKRHIPGAWYADLDHDLSAGTDLEAFCGGRHPLPTRERFAAWLGSTGLRPGTQVVVCESRGVTFCTRLWWMLKWCGHESVAVLDGGVDAWVAAGGTVVPGQPPQALDMSTPYPLSAPTVTARSAGEVARDLGSPTQILLDARATPRFRGDVEPLDPVAGHIPGALNRPFQDNFLPDGRFKPQAQLKEEFLGLLAGRDPACVVHHCGSGVTALPNLLAMEVAGLGRGTLFPGSWSEWCRTPDLPVARSS
ncbi:MAG: sulfurtransferase [Burkholderiaceae bacterium]